MFLANAFWTTQQWIINQQPVSKQINTRTVLFELPAYLISRLNSTPSEKKRIRQENYVVFPPAVQDLLAGRLLNHHMPTRITLMALQDPWPSLAALQLEARQAALGSSDHHTILGSYFYSSSTNLQLFLLRPALALHM